MPGRGRPSRARVYERLSQARTELDRHFGGLPGPKEARSIWADIWHQEAHHSTALEGNTLSLREVQMLLIGGRAVGAKPLREYNEVKGYADAASWVYGQALEPGDWHNGRLLTISEVRQLHHLATTPVWDMAPHPDATDREGPGSFREHDIQPFAGGMAPPTWPLVSARMQQWAEDVCSVADRNGRGSSDRWLPGELARLHNEFEQVHPFLDGNGRTGRLVINLVLVRLGYPPVVILKRQRAAYLAAMQRADGGDYGALAELIARAMEENLSRLIFPNVAGPARMIPLTALADEEFSVIAPRRAAPRRAARRSAGDSTRYRALTASGGVLARRSRPTARLSTSGGRKPAKQTL